MDHFAVADRRSHDLTPPRHHGIIGHPAPTNKTGLRDPRARHRAARDLTLPDDETVHQIRSVHVARIDEFGVLATHAVEGARVDDLGVLEVAAPDAPIGRADTVREADVGEIQAFIIIIRASDGGVIQDGAGDLAFWGEVVEVGVLEDGAVDGGSVGW